MFGVDNNSIENNQLPKIKKKNNNYTYITDVKSFG